MRRERFPEWGSGGPGFESRRPDQIKPSPKRTSGIEEVRRELAARRLHVYSTPRPSPSELSILAGVEQLGWSLSIPNQPDLRLGCRSSFEFDRDSTCCWRTRIVHAGSRMPCSTPQVIHRATVRRDHRPGRWRELPDRVPGYLRHRIPGARRGGARKHELYVARFTPLVRLAADQRSCSQLRDASRSRAGRQQPPPVTRLP